MIHSNRNRVALSIGFVALSIALASQEFEIGEVTIGFSTLLVNMMLGSTLCNLCVRADDIMERCEKWTTPLYALFIIISGAELDLSIFTNASMVMIGITYIISRCIGKYIGSAVSAKLTGCESEVVKFLGITLFPQAGVALGMCSTAAVLGRMDATVIRNVVLFGVMIYELIGPTLTKMSLEKAGEIVSKPKEKESHDRFLK